MADYKPIQIACPQLHKVVRGRYPADANGGFMARSSDMLDLDLVECSQDNGRCMETLCALHRYNRRGPGTWYPDKVMIMPQRNRAQQRSSQTPHTSGGGLDSTTDLLC